MNKSDRTILIERYLDGELQGDDLINFELQLKTDKELAQDCFLQKEIRAAFSNRDVYELRNQLSEISKEFKKEKQIKRFKKWVFLYAACAILVIAVISTICIFNKSNTNDELYATYFERYDAGTITRGAQKTNTDIYTQALRAYDLEKYYEAIELFKLIPDTSDFYTNKEYFTGLSYMSLQGFNDAIKHFENVISDNQSIFHENAVWYSGLCYLKLNQTQKAIIHFRKLLNKDCYLNKRASEILEKLE
ncbi:MAG: tetratricopeptide repeat protein [Bacteroidia bacterium]|nr:tetratricopeptide repeat protein [Bacteroidia bacterium]